MAFWLVDYFLRVLPSFLHTLFFYLSIIVFYAFLFAVYRHRQRRKREIFRLWVRNEKKQPADIGAQTDDVKVFYDAFIHRIWLDVRGERVRKSLNNFLSLYTHVNMDHSHVIKNITGYIVLDDDNVSFLFAGNVRCLLIKSYKRCFFPLLDFRDQTGSLSKVQS